MIPATIGVATSATNESLCEIRVFDRTGNVALTFLNSAIKTQTIRTSASTIPYAEVELSFDGGFFLPVLTEGALIEIWLHVQAGGSGHMLFRGVLEYIESSSEREETTEIVFEARGIAAALVDASFKGEIGTTVASVVERLVEHAGLQAKTEFPEQRLSAWINAQSSYAVLRLLGASIGAIVRTGDDRIHFERCLSCARERSPGGEARR